MLTSLPAWERGLKLRPLCTAGRGPGSLPAWERGLKSNTGYVTETYTPSLPAWERGLKSGNLQGQSDCGGRSPRGSVG